MELFIVIISTFSLLSASIFNIFLLLFPLLQRWVCVAKTTGPEWFCLFIWSLCTTKSCKLTYEGGTSSVSIWKSARIHATPAPWLWICSQNHGRRCLNEFMYAYLYMYAHTYTCTLPRVCCVCICCMRDQVHVRVFAHLCVSRFAIAMYSLPRLPFSIRRVQFPCPTNNPIYTPDYSGKRGEPRVAFNFLPSSTWSLPLSNLLEPLFLCACIDCC